MKKTEEVKLEIIDNFIDYYTTDDKERESMKECARDYVEEDHVDEIAQSFPEIAEKYSFKIGSRVVTTILKDKRFSVRNHSHANIFEVIQKGESNRYRLIFDRFDGIITVDEDEIELAKS